MRDKRIAGGGLTLLLAITVGSVFAAKPSTSTKTAKGDVKAGEKVFSQKFPSQCKSCHKYKGSGGTLGPDLTHAGKSMTADQLKAFIKNPKKVKPKTIMPPVQGSEKDLTDLAAFLATKK